MTVSSVLDVLENSQIEGNKLILPPLDRDTYGAINQVIKKVGGAKGENINVFIFPKDPNECLQEIAEELQNPERVARQLVSLPAVKNKIISIINGRENMSSNATMDLEAIKITMAKRREELSYSQIADILNEKGLTNGNGAEYNKQRVSDLFRIGEILEVVQGSLPAAASSGLETRMIKVSELKEHPKNKEFFQDITGEFWNIFLEDIRQSGITQPLTFNKRSGFVLKGNQRLRAARELGIDEVPCFIVDIEDSEIEVDDLIRDNIMRRDIDIFTKIKLVDKLKEKYQAKKPGPKSEIVAADYRPELKPSEKIASDLNVSRDFVSMANLYNTLTTEQQADVMAWFNSQEKQPTQKELNSKIKDVSELEEKLAAKDKEVHDLNNKIQAQILNQTKKENELKQIQSEMDGLKNELVRLQDLKGKEADIENTHKQLNELKNKKSELFSDIRSTQQIIDALVKSREFFAKELMVLPSFTLSESSKKRMSSEIKELTELVENWLFAVKEKFLAEV